VKKVTLLAEMFLTIFVPDIMCSNFIQRQILLYLLKLLFLTRLTISDKVNFEN